MGGPDPRRSRTLRPGQERAGPAPGRPAAGPGLRRELWQGIARTLGVVAGVVGFGLAWAAVLEGDYPGRAVDHRLRHGPEPSRWLVDGFNVLHAVVLGGRDRADWWKQERRTEVLELAAPLSEAGAEVWVVFDGPEQRCGEAVVESGVHEVFAPSADEWLVERARAGSDASQVAFVTADRRLVDRLERCGARVVSPMDFAERCRQAECAG